MDIVVDWVTQIIVFILLAAVIDLIIPTTSMRKYIKLVVGLIFILLFLQPVFYLFSVDIESEIESSITGLYEEETEANWLEKETNFKKREIQASQDAYILEEMVIQLRTVAEEPLLKKHQAQIDTIEFEFAADSEEVNYQNLEAVIVYLHESDHKEGVVGKVDEVIIGDDKNVDNHVDHDEIKQTLKEIWELEEKDIRIHWGGGTS
ncbi:MAG TPA: stage III sporulation protein AF [Virgibacillus sp.]|nr:stage III sporulation protein AF [Virgibacillus sp.]